MNRFGAFGEQRFLALANEFGWETDAAAIEAVLDGAERKTPP